MTTHQISRRGSRRQAGLDPGLYRMVLRPGVSRRLTPEPSRLDIGRTVIDRSLVAMSGARWHLPELALVLAEG